MKFGLKIIYFVFFALRLNLFAIEPIIQFCKLNIIIVIEDEVRFRFG